MRSSLGVTVLRVVRIVAPSGVFGLVEFGGGATKFIPRFLLNSIARVLFFFSWVVAIVANPCPGFAFS